MAYKPNDEVRIKHSTMVGVVLDAELDKTTLEIQYKVAYTDIEGLPAERYFKPEQLEALGG